MTHWGKAERRFAFSLCSGGFTVGLFFLVEPRRGTRARERETLRESGTVHQTTPHRERASERALGIVTAIVVKEGESGREQS